MSEMNNPTAAEQDREIIWRIANLIEEGSKGRKQITGHFFDSPDGEQVDGVCAMGACLAAVGVTPHIAYHSDEDSVFNPIEPLHIDYWPVIDYPEEADGMKPFAARSGKANLIDVVVYLNDAKGWSFERIVTYLRSLATATPETIPTTLETDPGKTG